MPDMVVFIAAVTCNSVGVYASCQAFSSDMAQGDAAVEFTSTIGWNKTQAKANSQIQDDAIAALSAAGHTIGANDNKILIAGVGGW